MDLLKEFEEYLPRWSEEKHLPIPTKQHMDRWYRAWKDFVDEELTQRWGELKDDYMNLKLYNPDEPPVETEEEEEVEEDIEQKESEIEQEEPQPTNAWEEIQALRKKLL